MPVVLVRQACGVAVAVGGLQAGEPCSPAMMGRKLVGVLGAFDHKATLPAKGQAMGMRGACMYWGIEIGPYWLAVEAVATQFVVSK
jgi:hypothetical protein